MIDAELLEILVCPESGQALRPARPEELSRLNQAVEAGTLTTRGGSTVRAPLREALVRDDGTLVYPVRDGIPIMLIDEAIPGTTAS